MKVCTDGDSDIFHSISADRTEKYQLAQKIWKKAERSMSTYYRSEDKQKGIPSSNHILLIIRLNS